MFVVCIYLGCDLYISTVIISYFSLYFAPTLYHICGYRYIDFENEMSRGSRSEPTYKIPILSPDSECTIDG